MPTPAVGSPLEGPPTSRVIYEPLARGVAFPAAGLREGRKGDCNDRQQTDG